MAARSPNIIKGKGAVKETAVTRNDVKGVLPPPDFTPSTRSFEDNTCTVRCNDDYKLRGIHQLALLTPSAVYYNLELETPFERLLKIATTLQFCCLDGTVSSQSLRK